MPISVVFSRFPLIPNVYRCNIDRLEDFGLPPLIGSMKLLANCIFFVFVLDAVNASQADMRWLAGAFDGIEPAIDQYLGGFFSVEFRSYKREMIQQRKLSRLMHQLTPLTVATDILFKTLLSDISSPILLPWLASLAWLEEAAKFPALLTKTSMLLKANDGLTFIAQPRNSDHEAIAAYTLWYRDTQLVVAARASDSVSEFFDDVIPILKKDLMFLSVFSNVPSVLVALGNVRAQIVIIVQELSEGPANWDAVDDFNMILTEYRSFFYRLQAAHFAIAEIELANHHSIMARAGTPVGRVAGVGRQIALIQSRVRWLQTNNLSLAYLHSLALRIASINLALPPADSHSLAEPVQSRPLTGGGRKRFLEGVYRLIFPKPG